MDQQNMIKVASRVIVLVVLVLVLLGVLTFTGIMKPNAVPGWCQIYWGVTSYATGGPRILIVYGTDGLGNPDGPCEEGLQQCSLKEVLANPEILGVHADTLPLSSVNIGNLRNYQMVIVEKAKTMETRQMRAFVDYYNQGGRLVWTGDAGTKLGPKDQYLYANERSEIDSNSIIGPWARKDGDVAVSLDQVLSVEYKANYCQVKNCMPNQAIYAGNIIPEKAAQNGLSRGFSASLPLYVFNNEDFALVDTISGGITTQAITLDTQSNLIGTSTKDYGHTFPFVVASGLGDRAIYYAMPPEYFANPKLIRAGKGPYLLPIENLLASSGLVCK